jgi:nucleotide-binding universal stress UspA family protein
MFHNILVPTDGSDLAAKAVEHAIQFAKEIGARITAVTITEPFPARWVSVEPSQFEYASTEYKKYSDADAEKVLDACQQWPHSQASNARRFRSTRTRGASQWWIGRRCRSTVFRLRKARSTRARSL